MVASTLLAVLLLALRLALAGVFASAAAGKALGFDAFAVFSAVLVLAPASRLADDCGCLGAWGGASTARALLRNAMLAAVAFAVAVDAEPLGVLDALRMLAG